MSTRALEIVVGKGRPIIPVAAETKLPLVQWKKYQKELPTYEEILEWWDKWPNALMGMPTGEFSKITVVDIDVAGRSGSELAEVLAQFPKTRTVSTPSGGCHLYYQYEPGYTTSANAYADFPHVDIRGDGGYVVIPPSKTQKGEYVLVGDFPLAKFPKHLLPLVKNRNPKKKLSTLPGLAQGEARNNALASFIGTLILAQHESSWESQVLPVVQALNQTFKPPLDEEEFLSVWNSITTREKSRLTGKSIVSPIQLSDEKQEEISLKSLGFTMNDKGGLTNDLSNCVRMIEHSKHIPSIRLNTLSGQTLFGDREITDADVLHVAVQIQDEFCRSMPPATVDKAVSIVADLHKFDPVLSWLDSLKWDGVPRVSTWLPTILRVQDSEYHRTVGEQWLRAIVDRQYVPGKTFDHALVLCGPQRIGKTSLLKILGGDYYREYVSSIDDKDFFQVLSGALIMDFDEGVVLSKADVMKVKGVITRREDTYRIPYSKRVETHKRRSVFSMTTNESDFLRDMTGNRRFLVVNCEVFFDLDLASEVRDQLFAEAVHLHKTKAPTPEIPADVAEEKQKASMEVHPWENDILEYLNKHRLLIEKGKPVLIRDIFVEALGGENSSRMKEADARTIGRILRSNDFESRVIRIGKYTHKAFFIKNQPEQEYVPDENEIF